MQHYQVEPPSPYVSFVVPLDDARLASNTLLGGIAQRILAQVAEFKPSLARQARFLELWAHNRPAATGHQLHFDSDNEGDTAVDGAATTPRHPLATSILYLTGAGGPTCVTAQRLASARPAPQAWLVAARPGRAVHMDGTVRHCVVPGNLWPPHAVGGGGGGGGGGGEEDETGATEAAATDGDSVATGRNRVSVMVALWRAIRLRPGPAPGAARPLPGDADWARALTAPLGEEDDVGGGTPVAPVPVRPAFERVADGAPWRPEDGIPDYDGIFQGI